MSRYAHDSAFCINTISYTAEMTTFQDVTPRCALDIEIYVLAGYLGRMEHLRHVR